MTISRRSFFKLSGSGAATLALPSVLHASKVKRHSDPLVRRCLILDPLPGLALPTYEKEENQTIAVSSSRPPLTEGWDRDPYLASVYVPTHIDVPSDIDTPEFNAVLDPLFVRLLIALQRNNISPTVSSRGNDIGYRVIESALTNIWKHDFRVGSILMHSDTFHLLKEMHRQRSVLAAHLDIEKKRFDTAGILVNDLIPVNRVFALSEPEYLGVVPLAWEGNQRKAGMGIIFPKGVSCLALESFLSGLLRG